MVGAGVPRHRLRSNDDDEPIETAAVAGAAGPGPGGHVERDGVIIGRSRNGTEGSPRWVAILAIAWLAGARDHAAAHGRLGVIKASRLVHGPHVNDPAILMMVGRIREELGIGRLIRVIEGSAPSMGPAALAPLADTPDSGFRNDWSATRFAPRHHHP